MFKQLSPDIFFSDCEECLAKGRCPRCGENTINDMSVCTECNWHLDDSNRGLPGSDVC